MTVRTRLVGTLAVGTLLVAGCAATGGPATAVARDDSMSQPVFTAPPVATTQPVSTAQPVHTSQPVHTFQPVSTGTEAVTVPWSAASPLETTIADPPAPATAPAGTRDCTGADFAASPTGSRPTSTTPTTPTTPTGSRTTPTDDGWLSTTFVLRSTAVSPCSVPPGYFVVDLLAASGVPLPGDAMPAGGTGNMFGPILVRPGQLAFGIIEWAADLRKVAPPQQLVFAIGGDPHPSRPISLSVGDVDVPAHPQSPDAQRPLRSGAYGRFTSVADPAALASLTATVIAPRTVAAGSTLRYTVVLANLTDTSVPLASCPEFDESVTLVRQKTPVSVTAGGPLNCARLPPAIAPGGAVTLQLEMRVAAEPVGDGSLTWHLHDGARAVLTGYTVITVRQ